MSVAHSRPCCLLLLLSTALGFAPKVASSFEPLRVFPPQGGTIYTLRFSPDGKFLASGGSGASNTVKLWDLETAKVAQAVSHERILNGFWFISKGKELVVTDVEPDAKIWNLSTGKARLTIPLLETGGTAFVTPDDKTLIVGSLKGAATLFDLKTGRLLAILKHSAEYATKMSLSPDGKTLATGHRCGSVILWDVAARKQTALFAPPERKSVDALAFSADNQTLAVGHSSGGSDVVLWDVKTGKQKSHTKFERDELRLIKDMAFTPEGKRLVIVGFGYTSMMLWDIEKKEAVPDFLIRTKPPESIQCLAISPDGKTIATGGGSDKRIKLWNLPPYKPRD